MMTLDELKQFLCDEGHEDAIVIEDESFCRAFIGVTPEGRAVYDYDKMVEALCEDDGITEEEAIDHIEYNTVRSIPYWGPMAPVLVHMLRDE